VKNLLIYTPILLIHISTISYVQDFLEIGNKWLYEVNRIFGNQTIDSIVITNDTFFNNHTYQKLVASKESPCGGFERIEYLRKLEGKVYRYDKEEGIDRLLIDYENETSYDVYYNSVSFQDVAIVNFDSTGYLKLPNNDTLNVRFVNVDNNGTTSDNWALTISEEFGYHYSIHFKPTLLKYMYSKLVPRADGFSLECVIFTI